MSQRKLIRAKPRKRILLIQRATRWRRDLSRAFKDAGWDVFEVDARDAGLRSMYELRPDMICLEVRVGENNCWDMFHSIRMFTPVPVVILADPVPGPNVLPDQDRSVIILSSTDSVLQIASTAKAFWKSRCALAISEGSVRDQATQPNQLKE